MSKTGVSAAYRRLTPLPIARKPFGNNIGKTSVHATLGSRIISVKRSEDYPIEITRAEDWIEVKDDIMEIEQACFHQNLRESEASLSSAFKDPNNIFLVLKDHKGKIIAYSYGTPLEKAEAVNTNDPECYRPKTLYVQSSAVLPDFQGKGIGKRLKQKMVECARERGYHNIAGHARSGASLKINLKHGAKVVKGFKNWGGTGETYCYYFLPLVEMAGRPAIKPKYAKAPKLSPWMHLYSLLAMPSKLFSHLYPTQTICRLYKAGFIKEAELLFERTLAAAEEFKSMGGDGRFVFSNIATQMLRERVFEIAGISAHSLIARGVEEAPGSEKYIIEQGFGEFEENHRFERQNAFLKELQTLLRQEKFESAIERMSFAPTPKEFNDTIIASITGSSIPQKKKAGLLGRLELLLPGAFLELAEAFHQIGCLKESQRCFQKAAKSLERENPVSSFVDRLRIASSTEKHLGYAAAEPAYRQLKDEYETWEHEDHFFLHLFHLTQVVGIQQQYGTSCFENNGLIEKIFRGFGWRSDDTELAGDFIAIIDKAGKTEEYQKRFGELDEKHSAAMENEVKKLSFHKERAAFFHTIAVLAKQSLETVKEAADRINASSPYKEGEEEVTADVISAKLTEEGMYEEALKYFRQYSGPSRDELFLWKIIAAGNPDRAYQLFLEHSEKKNLPNEDSIVSTIAAEMLKRGVELKQILTIIAGRHPTVYLSIMSELAFLDRFEEAWQVAEKVRYKHGFSLHLARNVLHLVERTLGSGGLVPEKAGTNHLDLVADDALEGLPKDLAKKIKRHPDSAQIISRIMSQNTRTAISEIPEYVAAKIKELFVFEEKKFKEDDLIRLSNFLMAAESISRSPVICQRLRQISEKYKDSGLLCRLAEMSSVFMELGEEDPLKNELEAIGFRRADIADSHGLRTALANMNRFLVEKLADKLGVKIDTKEVDRENLTWDLTNLVKLMRTIDTLKEELKHPQKLAFVVEHALVGDFKQAVAALEHNMRLRRELSIKGIDTSTWLNYSAERVFRTEGSAQIGVDQIAAKRELEESIKSLFGSNDEKRYGAFGMKSPKEEYVESEHRRRVGPYFSEFSGFLSRHGLNFSKGALVKNGGVKEEDLIAVAQFLLKLSVRFSKGAVSSEAKVIAQTAGNHLQGIVNELQDSSPALSPQILRVRMWKRVPQQDLFQGNFTVCCIAIDGKEGKGAIIDYLIDEGFNMIEILNNKGQVVSNALLWLAEDENGKITLVIDNVEVEPGHKKEKTKEEIAKNIFAFSKELSRAIGAEQIIIGTAYNDVEISAHAKEPKQKIKLKKIGGSIDNLPYYLDVFTGWVGDLEQLQESNAHKVD